MMYDKETGEPIEFRRTQKTKTPQGNLTTIAKQVVCDTGSDLIKKYHVTFDLGPLKIEQYITIDFTCYWTQVALHGTVPTLKRIKLGGANGLQQDGIALDFNKNGIEGTMKWYIKDKWQCNDYEIKALDQSFSGQFKLFPLPY